MLHPEFTTDGFRGLSEGELKAFLAVIGDMYGLGVEIGCMDGWSTVHILGYSNLILFSVDPFVPDSMDAGLRGDKARFLKNTQPFGHRSRLIEDFSYNVVKTWKTPIDFLFVDGDHNADAVRADLAQWCPHLLRGGVLAMHDSRALRGGPSYHPGPSEVAEAEVYGRSDQFEIIGEADSLTLARKL